MSKGLKIKNEHGATLFHASQTVGVECADDTKDDNSYLSKEKSDNENSDLNLNNSNNFNKNLSENAE